jgi:hypothetical protein
MSENLSDFFNLISEANKNKKKLKEEEDKFITQLIGANDVVDKILHELTGKEYGEQQELVDNLIEEVEEEVKDINDVVRNIISSEPQQDTRKYIKEGLLNIPSNEKNSDPLTPLDQKFATLEDLEKHYKLFLSRIQQQLSTIGGGGETRLRYLDDVVGVATNSAAYDGAFLQWNSSTNTAGFSTSIGGLLINETLDTVTDRGNTTTNGIGVSFVNLPVGSVISGQSEIIANIGNESLNAVLEYGNSATLDPGEYGLPVGIYGVPYAVYELNDVPTPAIQVLDIIGGAAIPVESEILYVGVGTYNKILIANKNFPVGGVLPEEDTLLTFARPIVNAGLSIATQADTDITLNPGAGGQVVTHADILPYTTNEWSLGSPAKRFKQIWFGTGTIYVQDEVLGNDQALGARDGNFYIDGGAGLEVGEWILRDNTLQIKNSARDVYIGSLGATADVIFNRAVRVENAVNRTAFYTDRTGRTQFYPPTIPANDIGGMSIIGSPNGAYQPITNAGGMLHITGNDASATRVTLDNFSSGITSSFNVIAARGANGTAQTPSQTLSGDILLRLSTVGWKLETGFGGATFASQSLDLVALENFYNASRGTAFKFFNAPLGGSSRNFSAQIDSTGLSFVGAGNTTGITFYDNSRLTYFPRQTSETADKFLKVTNEGGNYVMSWQTPPTVTGAVLYKGAYNVETNTPPVTNGIGAGATAQTGWQYTVVGVGTTNFGNGDLYLQDGDLIIHNGTHYDQIPGPRTQVNSDWNASTGVSAILNKPNIVNQIIGGTGVTLSPSNGIGTVTINATGTQNLNSVLTNGNTSALGINVGVVSATSYTGNGVNLTGIVTSIVAGTGGITVSGSTGRVTINGTAQVNSDWTSTVGVASILNKPTIPAAQVNSNWTATTGISSILNKPTIPAAQVNSDWTATTGISSILNKPTIVNQIIAGTGVTISPSNGIGTVTVNIDTSTVYPTERFINLTGIHTLASQTGVQPLFDADGGPTGGLISLGTGTYLFECNFYLKSIDNGNNGFGFALGGNATKTEGWQAIATKGSGVNTPRSPNMSWNTSANTSLTQSNGNECTAQIKGTIRITVAGTIIPQVSLGSAAAAIVQPNSYFRITRVGSATTSYN